MTLEQLEAVARAAAINAGIDPILVQAVCEHESSWNPWAVRYEPAFYVRYVEAMPGLTDTEKTMRATSLCAMMSTTSTITTIHRRQCLRRHLRLRLQRQSSKTASAV